jgi:hypothetical protein
MLVGKERVCFFVMSLYNIYKQMLVTFGVCSMGTDKVKRPIVGTGKVPTLAALVRVDHGANKGNLTLCRDYIPNPSLADSA